MLNASFDTHDKQELLSTLSTLIDQTYVIENEYKELKHAYEGLQNLLAGVIDSLPDPIWVMNSDGTLFLQNHQAQKLSVIPTMSTADNTELDIDGQHYLVKVSSASDRMIIQATDITTQRRSARLMAMGQMAAHLAHEIRNPLGSVSLLLSTLFNKVDFPVKPLVVEMKKGIWRVERIIKATLLFSKGVSLTKRHFALSECQNLIEEAVSYYTTSKEIDYLYFLPPLPVDADFELLNLVLQNLIFNAIDAIEESDDDVGLIEVLYNDTPQAHMITVYDSGVPIKNPEEIFEAFKTTKTKGTGLGLVLSAQIIAAHGGEIGLTTTKKGFYFTLPK